MDLKAVEAMDWKAVGAVEVLPMESTAQTRNEKEWLWNQMQEEECVGLWPPVTQ